MLQLRVKIRNRHIFKRLNKFKNNFFISIFYRFEFYKLLNFLNILHPPIFVFFKDVNLKLLESLPLGIQKLPIYLKSKQLFMLFPFLKPYGAGFRRLGLCLSDFLFVNSPEAFTLVYFLDKLTFGFKLVDREVTNLVFFTSIFIFFILNKLFFFFIYVQFIFFKYLSYKTCLLTINLLGSRVLITPAN